jgi:heat shock protein HslJ
MKYQRLRFSAVSLSTFLVLAMLPIGRAQNQGGSSLAGTRWRLVEIQSMADEIGRKRPSDPSAYSMTLNRDGTVSMRLNCNVANGKWSATPSSDSSRGQFAFAEPKAMTRALCPPPSFDEQTARQAQYVRSYFLKNGRLHLSLMTEGGIYVWEPFPETLKADAELEDAIRKASPDYSRGMTKAGYAYERIDMNGDGQEEMFVYLLGPFFCGTGGCELQLFTRGAKGYSLIQSFPITRTPIVVMKDQTRRWNTFWGIRSGGGARASYVQHVFNGKRYVVKARVPAGKVPSGKKLFEREITFENALPLEPRK